MNTGSRWMVAAALCGVVGWAHADTCPDKSEIEQTEVNGEFLFTTANGEWKGSDPSILESVKDVAFEAATIFPPKRKDDDSMGPTLVLCDYTGTGNGIRLSREFSGVAKLKGDRWNAKEPPSSCTDTDPSKCGFSIVQ